MNVTTKGNHRNDLGKDGEAPCPVRSQISKLPVSLKMFKKKLKTSDYVLPTDCHLRRDERTFNVHIERAQKLKKVNKAKKSLGDNIQDNKDTTKNSARRKKIKNADTEKVIAPIKNSGAISPKAETCFVYYRKKKLLTPPPHEISEVQEFLPAKKKKKLGERTSEDSSVKYLFEKQCKKKDCDVEIPSNTKTKKSKDPDSALQMKRIAEEQSNTKKKRKHKEVIVLETEDDDKLPGQKKVGSSKEKTRKTLSTNQIENKLAPMKPTVTAAKNIYNLLKRKKTPNGLNRKSGSVDRDELIEDFVAQIALNQSLICESGKKQNAEHYNKNFTIQNYESTEILDMEKTIANLNKKKTGLKNKVNKTLSKSYQELEGIMESWFKNDLKNIGESKKIKKKRRKSLELPRDAPESVDERQRSIGRNPVSTTLVVNNVSQNVIKRGQIRKNLEDILQTPKKVIERTSLGDNHSGSTSPKSSKVMPRGPKKSNTSKTTGGASSTSDKQPAHKGKTKENEESLYELIRELKEELGLKELFRVLKEQCQANRSPKNTGESVAKKSENAKSNKINPAKHKPHDVENNSDSCEGPSKSQRNKLNFLRDNMGDDIQKLIETTTLKKKTKTHKPITKDKTNTSKGNLETDLSNNDVNGLIYSPETLTKPDFNEPLTINTEDVNHQCNSDSNESAPLHIKHSPLSIKDEDYSEIDSDGSRTPEHHFDLKLENNVETKNNITPVGHGDQTISPRRWCNSEPIEKVPAVRNEDVGKGDFEYVQQLSSRQKRVLRDLEICLPFEPPLSHEIETTLSHEPTKREMSEFKNLGLKMKTKSFTLEEDALIRRNWLKFIKLHDLPNDPVPFLHFNHPYSIAAILLSESNKMKFAQFLGRDLNNRMLYSIHKRFKSLFTKLRTGEFTPEEDKIALYFMKEYKGSHNLYTKIARKLNRTRTSVQMHCNRLATKAVIDKSTQVVTDEMIIMVLMKTLKCDEVNKLKNEVLLSGTYKTVGVELDMTPGEVKSRWLTVIYPSLFSKIRDVNEIKRRFINLLIAKYEDDVTRIMYSNYAKKYFDGCTGNFLGQMLLNALEQVPEHKRLNLREALLYLQKRVLDTLPEVLLTTIDVPKSEF